VTQVELNASDARKLRLAAAWVAETIAPGGVLTELADAGLVREEVADRLREIADEAWPDPPPSAASG